MKYYLHDSNAFNDEKIHELFIRYGYEGLGLFYTMLEKFAAQEKPIKTVVLKSQLGVGKKLEKVWKFMEEIGIIHSNNGETFNKQLLNYSEKYKIKKEKTAERLKQWRDNQQSTENVTRSEHVCNASKVKLSKVKLSKVNDDDDETAPPPPPPPPQNYDPGIQTASGYKHPQELLADLTQDQIWMEELAMNRSISIEVLKELLAKFTKHLIMNKDILKTRKDYATHFRSWIVKSAPQPEITHRVISGNRDLN